MKRKGAAMIKSIDSLNAMLKSIKKNKQKTKKKLRVREMPKKNNQKLTRKQKRLLELEEAQRQKQVRRDQNRAVQKARAKARQRGAWNFSDASCRREMIEFDLQLKAGGLKLRSMTGDGNCLFRALADQLGSNASRHAEFRHSIVEYMCANRDNFEPFIEDDVPFDRYVSRMSKNCEWGGNLEIQAASMRFHCNLSIHQLGEPQWRVMNWPEDEVPMLHLSYHDGDHYNSVHRMSEAEMASSGAGEAAKLLAERAKKNDEQASQEEQIIMQCTSTDDLDMVRYLLGEFAHDSDTVIDVLCTSGDALHSEQRDAVVSALKDFYAQSSKASSDEAIAIAASLVDHSKIDSESSTSASSSSSLSSAAAATVEPGGAAPPQQHQRQQQQRPKRESKRDRRLRLQEERRVAKLARQQRRYEERVRAENGDDNTNHVDAELAARALRVLEI
jgi:OTU-like cysteine protease